MANNSMHTWQQTRDQSRRSRMYQNMHDLIWCQRNDILSLLTDRQTDRQTVRFSWPCLTSKEKSMPSIAYSLSSYLLLVLFSSSPLSTSPMLFDTQQMVSLSLSDQAARLTGQARRKLSWIYTCLYSRLASWTRRVLVRIWSFQS